LWHDEYMVSLENRDYLDHISQLILMLIRQGSEKQIYLFFHRYHAADIAEAMSLIPSEDKVSFLKKINIEYAAGLIEELEQETQQELFQQFKTAQAAKYIEEMDKDDAVDLLENLLQVDEIKASEIIRALSPDEAQEVQQLLAHEEGTAGAIMSSEYVHIPENLSVAEALAEFRRQNPPQNESSFYIYISSDANQLIGYTSIRDLLLADATETVHNIRYENPISVSITTDQEDVAKIIQKYDLSAVPVTNEHGSIVGIVTVDDIVDIVVDEATEDLYKLSGTGDIDELRLLRGNVFFAIQSRLPWLFITILGGMLASYIITDFSSIFQSEYLSLAVVLSFVPLLMGLAGNIGNQSSTIIVRGLSTGVLDISGTILVVLREVAIGASIGTVLAVSVYFALIFLGKATILAGLVALSIVLNMMVATFIGATLPLIFKRLGVDPAVASAPFISSTLDIIGQLIYFSLTVSILAQWVA